MTSAELGYRAVLFDMDGTLLNTLVDIGLAANRTLAANGFPEQALEDYRLYVGRGAEQLIRQILPVRENRPETVRICLEQFLADYSLHWKENSHPYPGIAEMLNVFTKLSFRMAILSNKPHAITVDCARELLSDWSFEIVWGLQEGIPRKPDPTGALQIAERMGLAPTDFLYLGDTAIDMKTATATGMFPIGALWGFRSRQELVESGAKLLIDHPLDLFDHLSML